MAQAVLWRIYRPSYTGLCRTQPRVGWPHEWDTDPGRAAHRDTSLVAPAGMLGGFLSPRSRPVFFRRPAPKGSCCPPPDSWSPPAGAVALPTSVFLRRPAPKRSAGPPEEASSPIAGGVLPSSASSVNHQPSTINYQSSIQPSKRDSVSCHPSNSRKVSGSDANRSLKRCNLRNKAQTPPRNQRTLDELPLHQTPAG